MYPVCAAAAAHTDDDDDDYYNFGGGGGGAVWQRVIMSAVLLLQLTLNFYFFFSSGIILIFFCFFLFLCTYRYFKVLFSIFFLRIIISMNLEKKIPNDNKIICTYLHRNHQTGFTVVTSPLYLYCSCCTIRIYLGRGDVGTNKTFFNQISPK